MIGWRGYAQRDPLNEYKQEAFSLFEYMLNHLREVVVSRLARVQIRVELTDEVMRSLKPQSNMQESRVDPAMSRASNVLAMPRPGAARDPQNPATWGRVARNEACPCGSNKKFKHCHGAI